MAVETREVGFCGSIFSSVVDDLLFVVQETDEFILRKKLR